jgi:ketosteroid isomerase-like protein
MRNTPAIGKTGFLLTLLAVFLVWIAAVPPASGASTSRTAEEAMATFDRFIDLYIAKNLDGIMALHDADVAVIGTNRDEQYIGRDALRKAYARDFARLDKINSIGWSVLSSGAQGSVAWVAADVRIACVIGGASRKISGRLTTVLRKKGRDWLIVQTHYSLPADVTTQRDVLITFRQMDVNGDGKLSFEEVRVWIRNVTPEAFGEADRNGDGFLSREEFELLRRN